MDYDDTTPWPECADGNGPTLELTSWDTDNELAENWACINDYGSPGRENVYILSNEVVDIQSISLRNNPIIEILEIINPENIKNLEFSVGGLIVTDSSIGGAGLTGVLSGLILRF